MKPNEICEGFTDWLARTGIAGKEIKSWGDKKYAQGAPERAQKSGGDNFISQLKTAFNSAFKSGLVDEPGKGSNVPVVPESNSFRNLINIVESTINEGRSIQQYAENYIAALTKNYKIDPDDKNVLKTIIADFSKKYNDTKNFPNDMADKLWNAIWTIGGQQQRDSRGNLISDTQQTYDLPDEDIVVQHQTIDYEFTKTDNKWKEKSSGREITKDSSIQTLNKLAEKL